MLDKKIYFPWVALFSSILVFTYFLAVGNEALLEALDLPAKLANPQIKAIVLIVFVFVILVDIVLFQLRKKEINSQLKKYDEQLTELYRSRNSLQNRAQKYSGHADKLKLFISDRLLEYIEYDEKFLHFQNIASEVRHNGVICYDKVNTALKHAAELSTEADKKQYLNAIHNMTYLWDLLDLSTTDNIGLYIANKLYEAEEHYFRQQLGDSDTEEPFSPIFSARQAVIKTIEPIVQDMGEVMSPETDEKSPYIFNNSRLRVHLDYAENLLGNENYVVLMLENLINNAMFYQNQRKYAHKHARVSVGLKKQGKYAQMSVYNNGPLIADDVKDKLFQLGFSTKRTKGVNGKGLGLYFVNEIIKGYEGRIIVNNVVNSPESYSIRLTLKNGETVNEKIEVKVNEDGKPDALVNNNSVNNNEVLFKLNDDVEKMQIAVHSRKKNYALNHLSSADFAVFYDPQNVISPDWCVESKKLKSGTRLVFKVIDKTGVQFDVYLPTAESRLDSDFYETDDEELDKLEDLDAEFNKFSEFTQNSSSS